ncbi:ABC transporter permease [Actinomyces minihominis]|uniref:ABC transporter permease n=1 Tax=Actinomyces minihominis TaxID=2002838 RepID=UPI001F5DA9E1|nr:ABC transporter permease [Actinomyces minihominis]
MSTLSGSPLLRQWNLIHNFGQRDLKTKFKGSALGWLWSLAVPLATLGIYSVVFSIIFRAQPPEMGNGSQGVFVIWLFCGLTAWTFFSSTINAGMSGLLGTGALLQKVYFPAYAPVLGAALASGVQWGIEVGILAVVLLILLNVGWSWLLIPLWAIIFIIFTSSLAVTVSILNIYFRDLAHLVAIALQLLFYMTPIIYPMSIVPTDWRGSINLQAILEINPLTQFVELFRSLIYGLDVGSWTQWVSILIWSAASLMLARWVTNAKGRDLGEHV